MKHIISFLFVISFLVGCTAVSEETQRTQPDAPAGSVLNLGSFIDQLQASGAVVTPVGNVSPTSETQLIKVNGEDIQVDEYDDEAAAAQAASFISPDGGQVTMPDPSNPELTIVSIVEWIATPHIYRNGRIIVHYIGDNQEIITLLESVLGPQFAGGVSESRLRLEAGVIEPAEGAPMRFEEAAQQAQFVVLAEVTAVEQGPDTYVNPEKTWCRPTQLVTVRVLKVYKGTLTTNQTQTIYQQAGVTDMDTGCGDNPEAEKVLLIMAHDPVYEVNQRYLLAFSPLANVFDPNPDMAAANMDINQLVETLNPGLVLFNGRLLVEQGGHASLDQADVVNTAYDDYGRTIPGTPTGKSLADYEALIAGWLGDGSAMMQPEPENSAHTVLQTFLTQLNTGNYEEAAFYYGGDYEWLREVNPDVPADDTAALLARGCELNGLVCLNIASLELVLETRGVYTFSVQFANEDGSLLTLTGCCGDDTGQAQDTFEFHVVQRGNQYQVQELPPYRP